MGRGLGPAGGVAPVWLRWVGGGGVMTELLWGSPLDGVFVAPVCVRGVCLVFLITSLVGLW